MVKSEVHEVRRPQAHNMAADVRPANSLAELGSAMSTRCSDALDDEPPTPSRKSKMIPKELTFLIFLSLEKVELWIPIYYKNLVKFSDPQRYGLVHMPTNQSAT